MNAYCRAICGILLACALGVGLGACSSSTSSAQQTAQKTSPPPASSNSSPQSVIAADWTAFFNAKTPVTKRISLLQDGQEFAAIIKAQAGSGLASGASAHVTKVTLVSATQAKVTYSILENGSPVLSSQTGISVNQHGTWKVGVASFCGLLAMENGGKTSSLPAACKTAG